MDDSLFAPPRFGARLALVATFAVMWPTLSNPARATVRNVPDDYATIQDAVNAAIDGDSVLVAPDTYGGPGFTNVSLLGKRLVISGSEPDASTILDGGNAERAFLVASEEPAGTEIKNLTLMNCRGSGQGGAILVFGAALTIDDCVFEQGGSGQGGAICVSGGTVTVRASTFVGNTAFEGGALYLSGAAVSVRDCVFYYNEGLNFGGAIACLGSQLSVETSTFVRGMSSSENGTVLMTSGSTVTLHRILAAYNNPIPGAFYCSDSDVTVTCSNAFANPGGWDGCLMGQGDLNGNFSADPLFCDFGGDDLRLRADSPCLPGNHPDGVDCGLIGALGEGCSAPTAVETITWGRLKSIFR